MRTQDEIVAHYRQEKHRDFLGFQFSVFAKFLDRDHLKEFCKPDADLSGHDPAPLTSEAITEIMRDYMEFAWGKVQDHRGISAGRSVEKMKAWLWLLGDTELADFAAADYNYAQYGAPVLAAICRKYNFEIPKGEDIRRMSEGLQCDPNGCDEGCGE